VSVHPRPRPLLVLTAAGAFMASLDLFVVNVAYPDLQRAFGQVDDATLSWVLNAYAIVFAALLVPLGRLADIHGRRRMFIIGCLAFAAASAMCAAVPSVGALIAARALQAAGAAALLPASLSMLLDGTSPARRSAAVSAWASAGALASALAVPAGALLVQLSWRAIFLINVPVAAVVIAGSVVYVRESQTGGRRADTLGALLLIAGLAVLTLGIVKADAFPLPTTAACLLGGAVLLTLFLVRSGRHAQPVVDLGLFRHRSFAAGTGISILFFVGFGAFVLCNILFLTRVWHDSALRAGLEFAPGPMLATVISVAGGARLIARFGHRAMALAGTLLFAASVLGRAFALRASGGYAPAFLPTLLVGATGIGLIVPTLPTVMTMELSPEQRATGSAIVAMSRQLGTVVGVALFVAAVAGAHYERVWLLIAGFELAAALVSLTIPALDRIVEAPASASAARRPERVPGSLVVSAPVEAGARQSTCSGSPSPP
jgi:EmrB/QacA subfamily drug resistance transporter